MRQEARLDQESVVDELVVLARLDAAVENQNLAVGVGLEDLHELELGPAGGDGAGDGVHVAFDRRGALEEPLVLRGTADPPTGTLATGILATGILATGILAPAGLWGMGAAWRKMPRWSSTTEAREAPSCSIR